MAYKGGLIGNDNLFVPDAPTIGDASASNAGVSVAFTAPSDVGNDAVTAYGASVTDGTNVFNGTASSSPVSVTGLTNGTSYTAQVWAINDYGSGPLSVATSSFTPAAPRGIFFGGQGPSSDSSVNTIDFITITTQGNAQDFGDIGQTSAMNAAVGSGSRSVVATGVYSGSASNVIEFVVPTSSGNATDFGDLTVSRSFLSGASSSTRGLFMAGGSGNVIDFITIASTGNAQDFGDTTRNSGGQCSAASPTRGIMAGGSGNSNVIEFTTIASAGNASDFGDLSNGGEDLTACSNNTKALMGMVNGKIETVNIASTGNATNFGETQYQNVLSSPMACSSDTRAIFAGGQRSSYYNNIEFFTIANTGNGTDFGDLTLARNRGAAIGTAHGGIA